MQTKMSSFFRNLHSYYDSYLDRNKEIQFSTTHDHRLNTVPKKFYTLYRLIAVSPIVKLYCNVCATTSIFLQQFSLIVIHERMTVCVPYVSFFRIGTVYVNTNQFILYSMIRYYTKQSTFRYKPLAIVLIVLWFYFCIFVACVSLRLCVTALCFQLLFFFHLESLVTLH